MWRRGCRQIVRTLAGILLALVAVLGAARAEAPWELEVEEVEAAIGRILQTGVWGGEIGRWRSKTQLIFDRSERQLVRRLVTIWDPMPSRDLDFAWTPVLDAAAAEGPIVSGEGRLVWRTRDRPSYDPRAVVIEYQGAMRNGRPEGRGR